MNNYTPDLLCVTHGDIVAFQVGKVQSVRLGDWYACTRNQIYKWESDFPSQQYYSILTPIDPRRLTLDGKPCVQERFTVGNHVPLGWPVTDNHTQERVAWFTQLDAAKSYAAEQNARGDSNV